MGNLCSTSRDKPGTDPFAQPGRTVSSAPLPQNSGTARPPPQTQTPAQAQRTKRQKVGGPARTLGGSGAGSSPESPEDARRKAAEAAEARARAAATPQGKLGQQLLAQKSKTVTGTLKEAAAEEQRRREADQVAEARSWR